MDAAEFKRLFLPLHPRLYRVAYRLTGDAQDAEDTVQDAYLKLWQRRDELDIRQIASKLDNIRILSSSRSAVVRQMKKEVAFITSGSGYEELMRVKDDKDHTTIYLKQGKSGKKEIVLLSADEEEFTIILITGSLTLQDIRGMIRREQ